MFQMHTCTPCLLGVQGLHVMASSWPATAYMLHKKDAPALLSEPTVLEVASRMSKHASQVLIRWSALTLSPACDPSQESRLLLTRTSQPRWAVLCREMKPGQG